MKFSSVTPLIISASRATDIPALHAKWFMQRLREGYCQWSNPFNPRQVQHVSFAQSAFVVFWSKYPAPLLANLKEISVRGLDYYFQFTLNDYELEGLEPGLPPLRKRVELFHRLADTAGPQRVVWRFDPVMLGAELTVDRLLERIDRLGRVLAPYTEVCIFSFLEMYRKTRVALNKRHPGLHPPTDEQKHAWAAGISSLRQSWPHWIQLQTCAVDMDYSVYGIEAGACIDGARIARLAPQRPELMELCHKGAKDTGQRRHCRCIKSKDIGAYDTCTLGCVYCYACHPRTNVSAVLAPQENAPQLMRAPQRSKHK